MRSRQGWQSFHAPSARDAYHDAGRALWLALPGNRPGLLETGGDGAAETRLRAAVTRPLNRKAKSRLGVMAAALTAVGSADSRPADRPMPAMGLIA